MANINLEFTPEQESRYKALLSMGVEHADAYMLTVRDIPFTISYELGVKISMMSWGNRCRIGPLNMKRHRCGFDVFYNDKQILKDVQLSDILNIFCGRSAADAVREVADGKHILITGTAQAD